MEKYTMIFQQQNDLSTANWGFGWYNVVSDTISAFLVLFCGLFSAQNGQEVFLKVIPLQVSLNINSVDVSMSWWVFFEAFILDALSGAIRLGVKLWNCLESSNVGSFFDLLVNLRWDFFSFGFVLFSDFLFKFLKSFEFFIVARKLTDIFLMFGFAFTYQALFMSFGLLSGIVKCSLELSFLLIDPFNIFIFLKVDMVIDPSKLVSGSIVKDSFDAFLNDVINSLSSVLFLNFNKCAMSASHFADYGN